MECGALIAVVEKDFPLPTLIRKMVESERIWKNFLFLQAKHAIKRERKGVRSRVKRRAAFLSDINVGQRPTL